LPVPTDGDGVPDGAGDGAGDGGGDSAGGDAKSILVGVAIKTIIFVVKKKIAESLAGEKDEPLRVGRWMDRSEYNRMVATGRLQEGTNGMTNVSYPASSTSYLGAKKGQVYAEFDIPGDSIKSGKLQLKDSKRGWYTWYGPNFKYKKGHPFPPVDNISDILEVK
jgi:hypothetical protein